VAREFALVMPVSRLMVNTLSSIGAVGATTELIPSLTLGCGSFGGNITSDNLTARHLINIKRMAYGTKEVNVPKPSSKSASPQWGASNHVDEIVNQVLSNVNGSDQLDPQVISELVNQVLKKYQMN